MSKVNEKGVSCGERGEDGERRDGEQRYRGAGVEVLCSGGGHPSSTVCVVSERDYRDNYDKGHVTEKGS